MVLRKILITGGSGRLGSYIIPELEKMKKFEVFYPNSKDLDICDKNKVESVMSSINPDLILHFAAYTDSKSAENIKDEWIKCMDINALGTINVLRYCSKNKKRLCYISTDAVFDGEKGNYRPSDLINPINKYARTKAAGEFCVRNYENSCIIRTAFFENNFPYEIAFEDQITSKSYIDIIGPEILNVCLNFEPSNIYHIGTEPISMYELAKKRRPSVKKTKLCKIGNLKIARNLSFSKIKKERY